MDFQKRDIPLYINIVGAALNDIYKHGKATGSTCHRRHTKVYLDERYLQKVLKVSCVYYVDFAMPYSVVYF